MESSHRPEGKHHVTTQQIAQPVTIVTGHASDVRPGDYLPPQSALHGTEHQANGFQVGPDTRDVTSSPVLSGRIMLFSRTARMLPLSETTPVTMHRPTT